MRIDVVTIFPEYLAPLDLSLVGKARARGQLDVRLHELRDFTHDVHRTVDDTPYGGGPGMVMKPEPWAEALDAVVASGPGEGAVPTLVVPTPSGRPFTQELAQRLAAEPWLAFAPARYEGIDRRVIEDAAERMPVVEVSIGDYVLAGGEVAVLVIVEAVARLLPGVLGNAESHQDDSFAPGRMADLLEGPVYTKPAEWRGHEVPEVLLSGHHGRIARWRREQAFARTLAHRPDLVARWRREDMDKHDLKALAELGVHWDEVAGRFLRSADDMAQ
jgi:tRNA (guanine37-N1)-methyltransferase